METIVRLPPLVKEGISHSAILCLTVSERCETGSIGRPRFTGEDRWIYLKLATGPVLQTVLL